MKKFLLLLWIMLISISASAQITKSTTLPTDVSAYDELPLSADMNKVLKACLALSNAASSNDKTAIKNASDSLKECNTEAFTSLRCNDDSITSVKGHLVFDQAFADSLAEDIDAYAKSEEISRTQTLRGQTSNGSILTKTCTVKAGKSTRYSFNSTGHQELAVAAEAGGKVTMKILVTNTSGFYKRYDDTKDVKQGRNFRKVVFDLPKDTRNKVSLEVVNCSKKDISFVVISN